jgi:hypothetical protein
MRPEYSPMLPRNPALAGYHHSPTSLACTTTSPRSIPHILITITTMPVPNANRAHIPRRVPFHIFLCLLSQALMRIQLAICTEELPQATHTTVERTMANINTIPQDGTAGSISAFAVHVSLILPVQVPHWTTPIRHTRSQTTVARPHTRFLTLEDFELDRRVAPISTPHPTEARCTIFRKERLMI